MKLASTRTALIAAAIVAIGAFILFHIGGADAQSACIEAITGDGAVIGSWDAGCLSENTPTEPTNPPSGTRYARFYTLTLNEGADITIDLTSATDTYMYLMEGTGANGAVLHENDDIVRGNTDSRISESLSVGNYTIEATTYDLTTTGTFTLTVTGLLAPVPSPTTQPGDPTPTTGPATPEPTSTVQPTPTQPTAPTNLLNRLTALETHVATQQRLISTMESKVTALDSRVAALETDASRPAPIPTVTPTATTIPESIVTPPTGNENTVPEIRGIASWINSEPLTFEEQRGKVVLVHFWTYTGVNSIRTLPYLKGWHEKYSDKGLVIVGVHTPEFEFEKDRENVLEATENLGIEWPVALDNDFRTWRAFNNRYWPALYLVDKDSLIRYTHFGEGAYEETELWIRGLLEETGVDLSDNSYTPTPETTATTTPIPLCTVIAPGADLRKCHFENKNFSGLILTGADFSGAFLAGAVFTDTIMIDVNLSNAILTGANFVNADLSGADLSGADARHAKFKDANLDRATVVGTQFRSGTSGDDAQMFRGTTLTHIVFDPGIKLTSVGFINADLSFSHFVGADLSNSDLRNATVTETDFSDANLNDANLSNVNLSRAIINARTDFEGADLSKADLSDMTITRGNFEEVDFEGANLSDSTFDRCDFRDANFKDADLSDSEFLDSDMDDADFDGADLEDTGFDDGTDLSGATNMDKADNVHDADFKDCTCPDGTENDCYPNNLIPQ